MGSPADPARRRRTETAMHVTKGDVPVKMDVPGAVARQLTGFGDASPYGEISGEYFSLAAGTDIAPLLEGLTDDVCHAPHWGYMLQGTVVLTYTGGEEETCTQGDLFFWPAGHSVRVVDDAEVILFSPQVEHTEVMAHMGAKLAGMAS
jgi:hypothetical protein